MASYEVGPVICRREVDPLTGEVRLYPIEEHRWVDLRGSTEDKPVEFVTAMFVVDPFTGAS